MLVLTADNMKKAEEKANAAGLSYEDMMERAGTKCAEEIAKTPETKKIVILCGKGKNGGDGLVIARKLWTAGFHNIFVILVHGAVSDALCSRMYALVEKYPVQMVDMTQEEACAVYHIRTAGTLVDAIFGIGFRGTLTGLSETAVRTANANQSAEKYAIDLPSGLSADGSYEGQLYFSAEKTLSMIAYKPVQVCKPTADFCGETLIMDIGVSEACTAPFAERYSVWTHQEAVASLRKRNSSDHKGCFGKVLTVCGSRNMTGCVYLCNQAAVEIGAGLVTAAFPEGVYGAVTPKLNEPLMLPLPENENGRILLSDVFMEKIRESSVIAAGCGIGVDRDTKKTIRYLLENAAVPVILDADALNSIAKEPDILKRAKCDLILTPHPGEMARLTGKPVADIQQNRLSFAAEFAKEYGVTLLLKGDNTVIASPDGRLVMNASGNPGMARGGSGDVLTGLIAGLVPQTADCFTAACAAAYLHGRAADQLAERYGLYAVTPTRLVQNLFLAWL